MAVHHVSVLEDIDRDPRKRLISRVRFGDAQAALALMRLVRSDAYGFDVEVEIVDAIYEARSQYKSKRLTFALAMLCARTKAQTRARRILLELVAEDYPPALHFLGTALIEEGRNAAGIRLLDLARASGYRLGDVAYWRYRAQVAKGPRRGLLTVRLLAARLSPNRSKPTPEDSDLSYWLPD